MLQLDLSTLLGIVSVILSVVGIIASYLPNRKVIKHHVTCTKLITATATKCPGLMVKYNDKPIQSLTVTTITFQNVGFQPIRPSDIVPLEPLGAYISGECFGYTLHSSYPKCALTATQTRIEAPEGIQGECTLNLHFDHLKRNEYFKISFLHDGTASPRGELISGKLKKDDKNKKDLIWSIFFELIYVAGIVWLSSYWATTILATIQSCDWSVPHSVLVTILPCIYGLFVIAWEIFFTIGNIQACYWSLK